MKTKDSSGKVRAYSLPKSFFFSVKMCFLSAPVLFTFFTVFALLYLPLTALNPFVISKFILIIQSGTIAQNATLFVLLGVLFLLFELSEQIQDTFQAWLYTIVVPEKLQPKMQKTYMEKLSKVKFSYFYSTAFRDDGFLARSAIDDNSAYLSVKHLYETIGSTFGLAISLAVVATFNIYLMLICIAAVAANILFNSLMAKKKYMLRATMVPEARQAEKYKGIVTTCQSVREIKGNLSSGFVEKEWEKHFRKAEKAKYKRSTVQARMDAIGTVINYATIAAVLALSVLFIKNGTLSIAAFAGIFVAIKNMTSMSTKFSDNYGKVSYDMLCVDQFRQFCSLSDDENFNAEVKPEKFKSLEFKNVSFAYPTFENGKETTLKNAKNVLSNLSFTIKKGECVAIVGENGSGKTTITKLMAKLYAPISGEILFNGKPLEKANLSGYRNNFTVVNQEFASYVLPLKDSLSSSVEDATENQMKRALKRASATDVLNKAKEHQGFETWMQREFDGIELSGGQKQKVSIARGLLKNAEVLIVDEPTSAIDPIAEEAILGSILSFTKGKTAIVISHRLSLCTKMDRIMYLENGELVKEGSHSQLMKIKSGKYRKLFNTQAKWYKRNNVEQKVQ